MLWFGDIINISKKRVGYNLQNAVNNLSMQISNLFDI